MMRTTSATVSSKVLAVRADDDGVVRDAQRRHRAAAVEVVAPPQVVEDGRRRRRSRRQVPLGGPPAGALLDADLEVELELGVRQHDRADVPSGHDDAAAGGHVALRRQERRPHARLARDGADAPVDLGGVELRR